jgi:hypothetical protein
LALLVLMVGPMMVWSRYQARADGLAEGGP